MIKKLLFSADDFGLSVEVNEAIEIAHRQGLLSTANLMIAGDAAEDAIKRAKRLPNLHVGLHLVTIEGNSVLPHSEIPSLIDQNNLFPSNALGMGVNYFFNPKAKEQLRREIYAQFNAFEKTGLKLDHVDVHKHMHLHPTVGKLLIEVGQSFNLTHVRLPHEPFAALKATGKAYYQAKAKDLILNYWTKILKWQLNNANIKYLDWCFGIAWCGHMTFDKISRLIANLPEGRSEIFFHLAVKNTNKFYALMPDYEPAEELAALCNPDLPKLLKEYGITPICWHDA